MKVDFYFLSPSSSSRLIFISHTIKSIARYIHIFIHLFIGEKCKSTDLNAIFSSVNRLF